MTNYKTVAVNRRARYEYDILETIEAGLALRGSEIKAIREGRANLTNAYARPITGELWLENLHIAQYSGVTYDDYNPTRLRKLLLHKIQIRKLISEVSEKRLTLVPLKLYLNRHYAKVELALVKGRKLHDKRRVLIERERERDAREGLGRSSWR